VQAGRVDGLPLLAGTDGQSDQGTEPGTKQSDSGGAGWTRDDRGCKAGAPGAWSNLPWRPRRALW